MYTDIVGFTRLAQRNEPLALELYAEHRKIVRSILPAHSGVVVKELGDGLLLTFESAMEASECAVKIQQQHKERNLRVGRERKFSIRIGIHSGDVIHRDGDVSGDVANVAQRVMCEAKPGGICISDAVKLHVASKSEVVQITEVGRKKLKNVEKPMDLWSVRVPKCRTSLENSALKPLLVFRGASVQKRVFGPKGAPQVGRSDLITAEIRVRNIDDSNGSILVTSIVDVVHHATGELSSPNLLAKPVMLVKSGASISVKHEYYASSGDEGILCDSAVVKGVANNDGDPPAPKQNFTTTFPGQIEILSDAKRGQDSQHGRVLSIAQIKGLRQKLEQVGRRNVWLMAIKWDRESVRFAKILKEIFVSAEWRVDGVWEDELIGGAGSGILVRCNPSAVGVGLQIVEAFTKANLQVRLVQKKDLNVEPIEIIVAPVE